MLKEKKGKEKPLFDPILSPGVSSFISKLLKLLFQLYFFQISVNLLSGIFITTLQKNSLLNSLMISMLLSLVVEFYLVTLSVKHKLLLSPS